MPRTWLVVAPSARQWAPPELLATLPPIVQADCEEGSGAKARPNGSASLLRSRLITPAPTHAVLFSTSISIWFIAVVDRTIPPSTGMAPAASPVPAPRATIGDPVSLRDPDDLGDFLCRFGEDHACRLTMHQGSISRIEVELDRLLEHPIATQHTTEIPDKAHSGQGSCGG